MKCRYIKSDGTLCNANALKDKSLCLFHLNQQKRFNENVLAVFERKTNKITYPSKPQFDIKNIDDIPNVLVSLINQIYGGTVETKRGGVIGYLTNILMKSFEVKELEKRIARVEGILNDVYISGDIDAMMNELHPNIEKELTEKDYEDEKAEN